MKYLKRTLEQFQDLEFDLWYKKIFIRDLTDYELSQYNFIKKLRIKEENKTTK